MRQWCSRVMSHTVHAGGSQFKRDTDESSQVEPKSKSTQCVWFKGKEGRAGGGWGGAATMKRCWWLGFIFALLLFGSARLLIHPCVSCHVPYWTTIGCITGLRAGWILGCCAPGSPLMSLPQRVPFAYITLLYEQTIGYASSKVITLLFIIVIIIEGGW